MKAKFVLFLVFILLFSSFFSLISEDLKFSVDIIDNTYMQSYSESDTILKLFTKYFSQVELDALEFEDYFYSKKLNEKENEYSAKIKEYLSKEDDASLKKLLQEQSENKEKIVLEKENYQNKKISYDVKKQNFTAFDLRSLFLKNKIIINYLKEEKKSDFIIVPSSIPLDNKLIRMRLFFYYCIEDSFIDVYDEVVSESDYQNLINDYFIRLFEYF